MMGALRRYRLLVTWVAIIGLVGNLVAATTCCLPSQAAAADSAIALLGPLVICSSHGATAPTPADDRRETPQPVTPCPLCLSPAGIAVAVALAAMLGLLPLPTRERVVFAFVTTLAEAFRRSGRRSRAPPLAA